MKKTNNLVAKHAHKFNRAATHIDRKKEAKKTACRRGVNHGKD